VSIHYRTPLLPFQALSQAQFSESRANQGTWGWVSIKGIVRQNNTLLFCHSQVPSFILLFFYFLWNREIEGDRAIRIKIKGEVLLICQSRAVDLKSGHNSGKKGHLAPELKGQIQTIGLVLSGVATSQFHKIYLLF
jgi:hypothetical protein